MKSLAHQQREIILNRYKIFVLLEYNDKGIPSQIGRNWSFDFLFDQARNMLIEKYGEEGLFVNSQQLWHKKSPLFYSANVDYMVMSESAFLEGRS